MERKIIKVPGPSSIHLSSVLESNGAEVSGYFPDGVVYESKYHSNGNYKSITLVGEFSVNYDENDLLEDTKITDQIEYRKKTFNYQIYVYSDEGPIPHFHIKGKGNDTDCCICIFEPRYFDHGTHVTTLNNKELKALDGFLRSQRFSGTTYWESIYNAWYIDNPDNYKKYPQLMLTKVQPDYTHMVGFKSGK